MDNIPRNMRQWPLPGRNVTLVGWASNASTNAFAASVGVGGLNILGCVNTRNTPLNTSSEKPTWSRPDIASFNHVQHRSWWSASCRNAFTRTLTSGLCTHEVLKRRVVRQVNSGLNALSPKYGDRRRVDNHRAIQRRQKLAQGLFNRHLQGLAFTGRIRFSRSQ